MFEMGPILHMRAQHVPFLAYLPQLGARLHLTHTQLNVFAVAGNGAVISCFLLCIPKFNFSWGVHERPGFGENC